MSRYRFTDSITVAASPTAAWELITDIGRTGEWSPVCTGAEFDDGDDARVGAHFTGHNFSGGRQWDTRNEVVAAEPGRSFAWIVNGLVRWRYDLEPDGDGVTVTESWELPEQGREVFHEKYGDNAQDVIDARVSEAHEGIPATLRALKAILES